MITGMDRLVAAIQGTPCDRVPVFCNLLDQGARELGISLREYYSSGQHVAEAQIRMRERLGYDNVWSLFFVGKEAELLGATKMIYSEEGPPNVAEFVIQSYDDIARIEVPHSIEADPRFEESLKCLRLLRSEVGGRYPICAYITATMSLPSMLMGMGPWMELLLSGPEPERNELLDRCHRFFVKEIEAYRNNGADVLIYSNPFGSTDTVPWKFFLQHSLPWIEKDVAAVGTPGLVYYAGMARFNRVIPTVLEKTGIGAYYISPLDDLAEAKAMIGDRGLTCGVINDIRLIDWSEAEIRAEVKRLMDAGKPGGHFLFGTAVMPLEISEANIRTMLDAAFEYGKHAEVEGTAPDGRVS